MNTSAPAPILTIQNIVVRYGSFTANDHINLEVHRGEVHALLGENGAGKTTLMKALVGLVQPQSGQITFEGHQVKLDSPVAAQNAGIGMVHQHFMLIPTLTVTQNVCIGLRSAGYPFPNLNKVAAELQALSERYNLRVNPGARVAQLSVGAQQRVEIIKALYRGARLLILDEPTSVLTPQETDALFEIIRSLTDQGIPVIFISHKLNEVMTISSRITVLRQGKVVATRATRETNAPELARLMVGHELSGTPARQPSQQDKEILRVEGLRYTDERGVETLLGVELTVRQGEIHGIAGVDGNGQEELARILAGLYQPAHGSIWLDGADITRASPARRIRRGLAYIPADRQTSGLVMDLSIMDNAILEVNTRPPYSVRGWLKNAEIKRLSANLIRSYDIRCRSMNQPVSTLSGGNQQKLVLARELFRNPRLIIAAQPSRGLDVGATEYVHSMLIEQRENGSAILLISTELDEIIALSDRVSVLFSGQIMGTFSRADLDRQTLGLLMAGKKP